MKSGKEPYKHVKREVHVCKETYEEWKKKPTSMSTETYMYEKRLTKTEKKNMKICSKIRTGMETHF